VSPNPDVNDVEDEKLETGDSDHGTTRRKKRARGSIISRETHRMKWSEDILIYASFFHVPALNLSVLIGVNVRLLFPPKSAFSRPGSACYVELFQADFLGRWKDPITLIRSFM
jgi:hypothetical protein